MNRKLLFFTQLLLINFLLQFNLTYSLSDKSKRKKLLAPFKGVLKECYKKTNRTKLETVVCKIRKNVFRTTQTKLSDTNSLAKVLPGEFPYLVSLRIGSEKESLHFCSGAIIHPRWVLTSIVCGLTFPMDQIMLNGSLLVMPNIDNQLPSQDKAVYPVKKIYLSTPLSKLMMDNVALFFVKKKIALSAKVTTIKIHKNKSVKDSTVSVAGWTFTDLSGLSHHELKVSPQLLKTKLKTIDHGNCPTESKELTTYICGQDENNKTLVADIGSPFVIKNSKPSFDLLIGTFFANFLSQSRSLLVASQVSHFINWIQHTLSTHKDVLP